MKLHKSDYHGVILWVIALTAIYIAIELSRQSYLDQEWLPRAGCLIVMLGIWSGLGGVIEEKFLQRSLMIKKHMAERRVRRAFSADKDEMEKELGKVQQEFEDKRFDLKNELGISVGVIEASLLLTGTLLWGFGDLLKYI